VSPERVLADVEDGARTDRSGTPGVGGEDAEVVAAGVRAGLEDTADHLEVCLFFLRGWRLGTLLLSFCSC